MIYFSKHLLHPEKTKVWPLKYLGDRYVNIHFIDRLPFNKRIAICGPNHEFCKANQNKKITSKPKQPKLTTT